jgi:hypothetical protein
MYKVKLIFLGIDSKETPLWSHQWTSWNGIDELDGIVEEWKDKEQSQLDHDNMDRKILYVLVAETQDCTDNKYHCGSCENYFAEPDDGDCPYCGGGNFVEGCIDDSANDSYDYQCTECEQFFNVPNKGNCPHCDSGLIAFHAKPDTDTKDKKCFNHCPKCDATDPEIEWHEKNWSGDAAWQNATCLKCGHKFSEVYVYAFTEQKHNR